MSTVYPDRASPPIDSVLSGGFTDDKRVTFAKLGSNRKSLPPKFYDSDSGIELLIPSDTEDALILLSSQQKAKAVGYMKLFADPVSIVATVADDYNDLVKEFADKQATVGDNVVSELSQITGKFSDFRDSVMQDAVVDPVIQSGLSRPLQAMVKSLGRIGKKDTREKFHQVFNSLASSAFSKNDNTELKRELRSWVRCFVSYP